MRTPKTNVSLFSAVLFRVLLARRKVDNVFTFQLQDNGTRISKAMRMFDQNLNGKIKKSDLKRVLENFAFHISKEQFEKFVIIQHFFNIIFNDVPS